jgi:hypothetical protein
VKFTKPGRPLPAPVGNADTGVEAEVPILSGWRKDIKFGTPPLRRAGGFAHSQTAHRREALWRSGDGKSGAKKRLRV